ncbi:hypothetical protein VBM87_02095 [Mycoplasma sp. 744]|uniref:hypothetical protein n=1 Tax=Mycoplasma sp. 744 TaxID=3108531 RepID=UPI002B1DB76D|nr:hypothetical protein [Mycoplasma sp. 744]MEA4115563.1 hypothetical protein [Mycoplasma sp. 744]
MKININNSIFSFDNLNIDKKISFIFGNNGTGKNSLTREIFKNYRENTEYKVMIYNGFENIVGQNDVLNAVVLGEKNKEIDDKVLILENKKNEIKKSIKDLEDQLNANTPNSLEAKKKNTNEIKKLKKKKLKILNKHLHLQLRKCQARK